MSLEARIVHFLIKFYLKKYPPIWLLNLKVMWVVRAKLMLYMLREKMTFEISVVIIRMHYVHLLYIILQSE